MLGKKLGLFLGPILFIIILLSPVPDALTPEAWKVIALAVLMLVWWVTEAVPLAVTSLLPIICLPLLGVLGRKAAAAPYANPVVFLFMGGFMIALAMERWNLHRRIALNIVRITGTNANGIILGFMLATAALSMWISNTATTVMMLPIALSVIDLLKSSNENLPKKGVRHFALALMLGIAYSANIGGTATIIGTPPNVVFSGFIRETYDLEVSFATWMAFGVPFAILLIGLTYLFIVKWLYPNQLGDFEGAQELIEKEVHALGKISNAEKKVLIVFVSTALLWMFRSRIVKLIPALPLNDEGIALVATVALFVIPLDFKNGRFLMEWKDTAKLPWGILLLFGGGLSLANALAETGLIDLIGAQFKGLDNVGLLVILGLTAVSLFLTEIMSNVALVTIFLPVVGAIAVGMGIDPLLICIPVTLAASCAFMLPMSTPPNAIVFASGHLKVAEMVRAGIVLNIISILFIAILAHYILGLLI
ncbi:MAG: SLC13 family permease [Saprospiraceae bacterium]|nr:SLC13 family permease [Saprospiraceae bacterium]